MSRIGCGEVSPRSRRFFQTRECAVWVLWLISVVVGALAVAVTFFVLNHRQYALYEATHENFFTFMVEVLQWAVSPRMTCCVANSVIWRIAPWYLWITDWRQSTSSQLLRMTRGMPCNGWRLTLLI